LPAAAKFDPVFIDDPIFAVDFGSYWVLNCLLAVNWQYLRA
jgi:hypothetical protein